MQTKLGHILFSVAPEHLAFYRDLLQFLGWRIIYTDETMLGVADVNETSFWFGLHTKTGSNDYDNPGINHLAIHTTTQAEVDQVVGYLTDHGVPALFETPRHRPEFSSEGQTYYQVMFESPDRVLFEVVYTGPKVD